MTGTQRDLFKLGRSVYAFSLGYIGITKLLLCNNNQLQHQYFTFIAHEPTQDNSDNLYLIYIVDVYAEAILYLSSAFLNFQRRQSKGPLLGLAFQLVFKLCDA